MKKILRLPLENFLPLIYRGLSLLLVLSFAFILPSSRCFAISDADLALLTKDWIEFRDLHKEPTPLRVLVPTFIKKSPVIRQLLTQEEDLHWEQVAPCLTPLSESSSDVLSQEEFELAVLTTQMSLEIQRSNEHRYLVMELAESIYKTMKKTKKTYEKNLLLSLKQQLKKQRKADKKTIDTYNDLIQKAHARIQESKKHQERLQELPQSKKVALPSGRDNTRLRLKILATIAEENNKWKEANQDQIQQFQKFISADLAFIEDYKKQIRQIQEDAREREARKVVFNYETTTASDLPVLNGAMPVLKMLENGLSGEDLRLTLKSVGRDLFLTTEYFSEMPELLLNDQSEYAARALVFVEKTISSLTTEKMGQALLEMREMGANLTEEHLLAYRQLVFHLKRLHEFEIRARKMRATIEAKRILDSAQALQESIPSLFSEVLEESEETEKLSPQISPKGNSPESLPSLPGELKEPTHKVRSLLYKGEQWTVVIKKYVNREVEALHHSKQVQSFDALVKTLGDQGPILNVGESKIQNAWRNFGSLTSRDFHCHLGSSALVTVWRVLDPKEKVLVVYYLGDHPTTYKRILKKL